MPRPSTHIVGLDIGQTKVSVLIAEPRDGGAIDVLGFGSAPSRGMRKGVVVNLDACVASIKQAVEEAELQAGCSADRAFVGVVERGRLTASLILDIAGGLEGTK